MKRIRDLDGTTQVQFGQLFGVRQQTIARWESGFPMRSNYRDKATTLLNLTPLDLQLLDDGQYQCGILSESFVPQNRQTQEYVGLTLSKDQVVPHMLGSFAVRIQNGPPLSEHEIGLLHHLISL